MVVHEKKMLSNIIDEKIMRKLKYEKIKRRMHGQSIGLRKVCRPT